MTSIMTSPAKSQDDPCPIADFKEMIRRSSSVIGGYDGASLVSLDDLDHFLDDEMGLLLDQEDPDGSSSPDEEENCSERSRKSPLVDNDSSEQHGESSSLVHDQEECDAEYCNEEQNEVLVGCHQLILHRIKANPSLSIATLFMGILTVYLWTDERFRFILRNNRNSNMDNNNPSKGLHGSRMKSTTSINDSSKQKYPAFPAKALLGIIIHGTPKSKAHSQQVEVTPSPMEMDVEPPYDPTDFQYEKFGRNRTLLYWEEVVAAIEQTQSIREEVETEAAASIEYESSPFMNESITELWANMSLWGPCYPHVLPPAEDYGNRMLRSVQHGSQQAGRGRNWTYIVQSNADQITDEDSIVYPNYRPAYHRSSKSGMAEMESLGGMCRPGFLIIGQGKCGTSSLYKYLTGHPRILPAREKQIHYFRYHKSKPLMWYYSHFPTIESFLGRGALMTGEASPGYMPYPTVVEAIAKRLSPASEDNGVDAVKGHVKSSLPKIIAIVRDPITRAISSYKYNYIEPALKTLRSGRGISASGEKIPGSKTDRYYKEHHLFTFEELAYAELTMLRDCLATGGRGQAWTRNRFGKQPDQFFYDSIQRRMKNSSINGSESQLPPLIHLDEACYVATKSKTVPRVQWRDLAIEHPKKVLGLPNLQLTQSIIGRGVYSLPLEWWYEVFSFPSAAKEDHIHVACTENMANTPDVVMDDVTSFLGLPEFDFTNVTGVGRYNVGGHRGYDTVTKSHDGDNGTHGAKAPGSGKIVQQDSPSDATGGIDLTAISDAFRNELNQFYRPYNERLFEMIGKRCPWEE